MYATTVWTGIPVYMIILQYKMTHKSKITYLYHILLGMYLFGSWSKITT